MKRFRLHYLGLLACAVGLASTPVLADGLGDTLDRILADPALKGGISGALVERVDTGNVVYARDADTRLMPASNRKLFTSAAALELLGSGFTFTTRALSNAGPDAAGTLHGDLYLQGVGDSLLSPGDLDDMAGAIATAGVKRIDGKVIGDGTLFRDGPYGEAWEWDDLTYYYAAQIGGLNVNRGVVTIHVTPGAFVDAPVRVTVDPPTQYLPVTSTATTTAAGSAASACAVTRPWDQNVAQVTGTLPVGGHADATLTTENPARFAATVLAEALQRHGIGLGGPPDTGTTPDAAKTALATHTSVPMSEYIAKMNKPSDNLLAESLVRVIGVSKGVGGTYASGHAAEMAFFKELGVQVGDGNVDLYDGSGLARKDLVTPRAVVALLRGMHAKADWAAFNTSLPIAGVDGDLRNRMKGTRAAANVHAKTGSLHGVAGLSGYVTGTHGDLYAFSLLLNNFPGTADAARVVQDRFAVALADGL